MNFFSIRYFWPEGKKHHRFPPGTENSVNASFLWTPCRGLLHSEKVLLASPVLLRLSLQTWHDVELLEDKKELVKCHNFSSSTLPLIVCFCTVIRHSALEVFSISKTYCSWAASLIKSWVLQSREVVSIKTWNTAAFIFGPSAFCCVVLVHLISLP